MDNIIWHTDFRARREREAAELEAVTSFVENIALNDPSEILTHCVKYLAKSDTSPGEMNPQDSA